MEKVMRVEVYPDGMGGVLRQIDIEVRRIDNIETEKKIKDFFNSIDINEPESCKAEPSDDISYVKDGYLNKV